MQNRLVEQVLDPDADPCGLVCVGRADAASGRADPRLAQVALGDLIEGDLVRHDQVRVGRDQQPVAGDPARLDPGDLLDQDRRVDHDPVADHRRSVIGQHAGRQQMQRVALFADHDRVPGVVAALVPDHVVDAVAEQVRRLALALIAPLGANNHDGGHDYRLATACSRALVYLRRLPRAPLRRSGSTRAGTP